MQLNLKFVSVALIALISYLGAAAQNQPVPDLPPDSKAMTAALALRYDIAAAVVKGNEKSSAAISRLKSAKFPSGLTLDHDADLSFAAIDIGMRLWGVDRYDDARAFFGEAEAGLELVLKRTPDKSAAEKASTLQTLSMIRFRFLDKFVQAKADIDQAIALQPEDKYLRDFRANLANSRSDLFKDNSKTGN